MSTVVGPLAIVAVLGTLDYLTGLEYSLDVFYLVPIALAVWFVGLRYGLALAVVSAGTSFVLNGLPKAQGWHLGAIIWNGMILLSFYLVVVRMLANLRRSRDQLERRVQEQTAALRSEIAERERLEREILDIGERERQRIGHDLHDSLCQHLTAAALAGEVLAGQLESQPDMASGARKVVDIVQGGITMARNLSHGLGPVELTAGGLMEALEELSVNISERFGLDCRFECDVPVLIRDAATATHLYRIAQEAISNAIKHGQAKHVVVRLAKTEAGTVLEVIDDGVGLPESMPAGRGTGGGMGLRIMAHRATMIGAAFTASRGRDGGTVIACTVP